MDRITDTVLCLLRAALFGEALPVLPEDTDWSAVYRESYMHAVDTVFAGIIKDLPLSEELAHIWKTGNLKNLLMTEADLHTAGRIHRLFEANNIRYAVLKGLAAAKYYPRAYLRACGDIDILVQRSQFDRAVDLLASAGFTRQESDEPDARHETFSDSDTLIELHRYFDMTDAGNEMDARLNQLLSDELERTVVNYCHPDGTISEKVDTGAAFRSFRDDVNGIIILYHICAHLALGIGYRQMVDFLMFSVNCLTDENRCGDETQPPFVAIAESLDLDVSAKAIIRAGQLYLGFPEAITWCREADDGLCRQLMAYITDKGNFGCKTESKENNRTIEILNTSRGNLRTRLDYETKIGLDHWPAARANPLLRRFAWICGVGHHIRMLFKLHLVRSFFKDLSTSKRQSKLLDSLHIMKYQS